MSNEIRPAMAQAADTAAMLLIVGPNSPSVKQALLNVKDIAQESLSPQDYQDAVNRGIARAQQILYN